MRLQRFTATTFSQAMNRVRTELGEDAIIVSSFEEKGLYHITATIESEPPSSDLSVREELYTTIGRHAFPAITESQLRNFIQSMAESANDATHCLARALDHVLCFSNINLKQLSGLEDNSQPTPLVVIGPPGAGKTASIAKLAVEATLLDLNPIVITLDAEKAGALAQLSSFTEALSIPFMKAECKKELHDIVNNHHGLVLVDTTGLNPYDNGQIAFAKEMLSTIKCKIMLVLPTGLDLEEAKDMMTIFHTLNPSCLLFTKIDMAKRLGGMIGLSIYSKLPLACYGNSPRISSPLVPFTANNLSRLLLNNFNETIVFEK